MSLNKSSKLIEQVAEIVIILAKEQLESRASVPDTLEMHEIWKLVHDRFSHVPEGRTILKKLQSMKNTSVVRVPLMAFLTEYIEIDIAFFETLVKRFTAIKKQQIKKIAPEQSVGELDHPPVLRGIRKNNEPESSKEKKEEDVHFTVFHPKQLIPKKWSDFLAYVHLPECLNLVTNDSKLYFKNTHNNMGKNSVVLFRLR